MLSRMSILLLIVTICFAFALLYALNKYASPPWKGIGIGVVLVALVIWFLYWLFGDAIFSAHVGHARP